MIQPSPSSTSAVTALPIDLAGPVTSMQAQSAGFGAFLSVLTDSVVGLPAVASEPSAPIPSLASNAPGPAIPGKILPPALPVGSLPQDLGQTSSPDGKGAESGPAPQGSLGKAEPGKKLRPVAEVQLEHSADGIAAILPDPAEAKPAKLPEHDCVFPSVAIPKTAITDAIPVSEVIALTSKQSPIAVNEVPISPIAVVNSALAGTGAPKPEPVLVSEAGPKGTAHTPPPKAQGPIQRVIPTLPETASAQAQLRNEQHRSEVPTGLADPVATAAPVLAAKPERPIMRPLPIDAKPTATSEPAEPVAIAASQPVPRAAGTVQFALPLSQPAVTGSRPLPSARLALPIASARMDDITTETAAIVPANAGLTLPQVLPATAQVPHVRPHDFTALIERLSVAREAFSPQAVSITLAHQEFGPVRLNFRPEDAGLSVTLSSPDPDFARAAAAAPSPVLPATASEQAGSAMQQRGEDRSAHSGSNAGGFTHSRDGSSERREGQAQPHHNPSPRGGSGHQSGRQGIFA